MEPIEALGPVVSIVVIIFIAIFVILWLFLPFVVYGIQTQATKIHYLAIENNKIQRQNCLMKPNVSTMKISSLRCWEN